MYAVFQSEKRKRILVIGSSTRTRISEILEAEEPDSCDYEHAPPDAPIFNDNRSHNLSRWRNKHRVEKMGKRRGRKYRK